MVTGATAEKWKIFTFLHVVVNVKYIHIKVAVRPVLARMVYKYIAICIKRWQKIIQNKYFVSFKTIRIGKNGNKWGWGDMCPAPGGWVTPVISQKLKKPPPDRSESRAKRLFLPHFLMYLTCICQVKRRETGRLNQVFSSFIKFYKGYCHIWQVILRYISKCFCRSYIADILFRITWQMWQDDPWSLTA